jgi:hypothetical protein
MCRFSAAGNDSLTMRYGDRRLKSAKARSRGSWALAGSERYRDFDISAELVFGREADTPSASTMDCPIGSKGGNPDRRSFHNFRVSA